MRTIDFDELKEFSNKVLEEVMVSTDNYVLQLELENELFSRWFPAGLNVIVTKWEMCYETNTTCPKSLHAKCELEDMEDIPF